MIDRTAGLTPRNQNILHHPPALAHSGVEGWNWRRIERLRNKAESLQLIRRVSDIPVPQLYGPFEFDGFYILIMEYIQGITLSDLPEHQQQNVGYV